MQTDTPQDLAALIEEMKPAIVAQLKDAASKAVCQSLEWQIRSAVENAASEYIKAEILPAVQAELMARRAEMIASIVASVQDVGTKIGETLQARAVKALAQDYKAGKFFSELFGN